MVEIVEVRDYMKKLAKEDRERRTVQVSGVSIEDALAQASIELSVPKKQLEYELIQQHSSGFLGYGKKDCIIFSL